MTRIRAAAAALTLTVTMTLAGLALAADGPAADMKALDDAYKSAMTEWQAPMREAKTPDERKKVKLDPAKDPRREFLPKYLELAKRAKGTPEGAKALSMVLFQATSLGDDGKPLMKAARELVETEYAACGDADDIAWRVALMNEPPAGSDFAAVRDAFAKSKSPAIAAAIAHAPQAKVLGDRKADAAAKAAAVDAMDALAKAHPDTKYGRKARGVVNAERVLLVGKPALDFTATDQDGKTFKLSDYRGKVVLLDFWGLW